MKRAKLERSGELVNEHHLFSVLRRKVVNLVFFGGDVIFEFFLGLHGGSENIVLLIEIATPSLFQASVQRTALCRLEIVVGEDEHNASDRHQSLRADVVLRVVPSDVGVHSCLLANSLHELLGSKLLLLVGYFLCFLMQESSNFGVERAKEILPRMKRR